MYNRNDPRFRRTLNQISQNLESANETAQFGLFSATEHCLKPCFLSLSNCIQQSTDAVCPGRDDSTRPRRATRTKRASHGRGRSRPELSFDFYDDWEADENDALLGPRNDEFERLLGEQPQEEAVEPGKRTIMNYGSQGTSAPVAARGQKFSTTARQKQKQRYEGAQDPTVIPNQSYFGFLDKLPFGFRSRGLRYKPSAADLQERQPRSGGKKRRKNLESDRLLEENFTAGPDKIKTKNETSTRRKRSDTMESDRTADSLSSRADIFPSDEEDDAVPLDDEFAVALERRTTGSGSGGRDHSTNSGKSRNSMQPDENPRRPSADEGGRVMIETSRSPSKSQDDKPTVGETPVDSSQQSVQEEPFMVLRDASQHEIDASIATTDKPLPETEHGSPTEGGKAAAKRETLRSSTVDGGLDDGS